MKRYIYAVKTTMYGVIVRPTDEQRKEAIEDMVGRFESASKIDMAEFR